MGQDNKFGHPNDEIIQILENYRIKIYRTDLNGEIMLKIKSNGKINIKTKV